MDLLSSWAPQNVSSGKRTISGIGSWSARRSAVSISSCLSSSANRTKVHITVLISRQVQTSCYTPLGSLERYTGRKLWGLQQKGREQEQKGREQEPWTHSINSLLDLEEPTMQSFNVYSSISFDKKSRLCLALILLYMSAEKNSCTHRQILQNRQWTLSFSCWHLYLRIINIQQPVETHINTEWDIHQFLVLLFHPTVNCSETTNHILNTEELVILVQLVL